MVAGSGGRETTQVVAYQAKNMPYNLLRNSIGVRPTKHDFTCTYIAGARVKSRNRGVNAVP